MYTLYYLNRNLQLQSMKVDDLDNPIRIPEDLVFCNLRKGINFIKEPHQCIDFTDTERLIMNSEFTDVKLLKEHDFRRENTYLTPLCQVDIPPMVLILYFIGNDLYFNVSNYPMEGLVITLQMSSDGVNYNTSVTVATDPLMICDFIGIDVDNEGTYKLTDVYQEGKNFLRFVGGELTVISNVYQKP
jgi:hypothetical protein